MGGGGRQAFPNHVLVHLSRVPLFQRFLSQSVIITDSLWQLVKVCFKFNTTEFPIQCESPTRHLKFKEETPNKSEIDCGQNNLTQCAPVVADILYTCRGMY